MTRRLLPWLLSLLLLAGQQLAVAHAYWHADTHASTADGHAHHKGNGGFQGSLCDLHALLHDLCDTPQAFVPSLPVATTANDAVQVPIVVLRTTRTPLPPPRGPPLLLSA